MTHVPLDQLTLASFAELLHSQFRVHVGPATVVELELVEATATPNARMEAAADSALGNFSLIFSGPADRLLAQQMYRFEHPQIGAFDLFIVPIGREEGRLRYQAIFNRSFPRLPR